MKRKENTYSRDWRVKWPWEKFHTRAWITASTPAESRGIPVSLQFGNNGWLEMKTMLPQRFQLLVWLGQFTDWIHGALSPVGCWTGWGRSGIQNSSRNLEFQWGYSHSNPILLRESDQLESKRKNTSHWKAKRGGEGVNDRPLGSPRTSAGFIKYRTIAWLPCFKMSMGIFCNPLNDSSLTWSKLRETVKIPVQEKKRIETRNGWLKGL